MVDTDDRNFWWNAGVDGGGGKLSRLLKWREEKSKQDRRVVAEN